MPRAVLIGNYGVGNLGDDALEQYFLRTFPEVEWTIVRAEGWKEKKEIVPRLPFGIRSLFTPWWRTIFAILRADRIVVGGGSLFTDIESLRAVLLWSFHALIAIIFQKPFILAFQGIGPCNTWIGRGLTRFVLSHASQISVRDHVSASFVKSLLSNKKIVQTFDAIYKEFCSFKKESIKNVFIINPRDNSSKKFIDHSVADALQSFKAGTCTEVHIVLLKPDDRRECSIAEQLRSSFVNIPCQVVPVRSVQDLQHALQNAHSMMTQRYHGALAAMAQGIHLTIVPQGEGDKLDALQKFILEHGDVAGAKALELIEVGEREMREFLRGFKG